MILMRKIVITSSLTELKKFLKAEKDDFSYIFISKDLGNLRSELQKRSIREISIENVSEEVKDRFMKDYIDMIGKLSQRNNTIYWWACSISSKNPFLSKLYQNIYYYCKIIEQINSSKSNLILLSNNQILNENLEQYCLKHSIQYIYQGDQKRTYESTGSPGTLVPDDCQDYWRIQSRANNHLWTGKDYPKDNK